MKSLIEVRTLLEDAGGYAIDDATLFAIEDTIMWLDDLQGLVRSDEEVAAMTRSEFEESICAVLDVLRSPQANDDERSES